MKIKFLTPIVCMLGHGQKGVKADWRGALLDGIFELGAESSRNQGTGSADNEKNGRRPVLLQNESESASLYFSRKPS